MIIPDKKAFTLVCKEFLQKFFRLPPDIEILDIEKVDGFTFKLILAGEGLPKEVKKNQQVTLVYKTVFNQKINDYILEEILVNDLS